MDESGIFPVPTTKDIPTHSTPIKPSIPPFSTRSRSQSKKILSVPPQGTSCSTNSPALPLKTDSFKRPNDVGTFSLQKSKGLSLLHDENEIVLSMYDGFGNDKQENPNFSNPRDTAEKMKNDIMKNNSRHQSLQKSEESPHNYRSDDALKEIFTKYQPKVSSNPVKELVPYENDKEHDYIKVINPSTNNIDQSGCPKAKADTNCNSPKSQGTKDYYRHGSGKIPEKYSFKSNTPSLDSLTINKQRSEIQILVAELRDRDRELNEMTMAHQHQLQAWEHDRHRLLTLEQKCHNYHEEVKCRTKQLRLVMSQLKSMQNESTSKNSTLETTQDQLTRLTEENTEHVKFVHDLKEENIQLKKTLTELSGTQGQFQAREQELMTKIKMKDRDLSQASNQLKELREQLQGLDTRARECQTREMHFVKQINHWKEQYILKKDNLRESKEALKVKTGELQQQMNLTNAIKDQLIVLQEESASNVESKVLLIESLKSKQTRTDSQLKQLRELFERQQRELTLLQLNLESSKDIINKQQSSLEEMSVSRSCLSCSKSFSRITADLSSHQMVSDKQKDSLSPLISYRHSNQSEHYSSPANDKRSLSPSMDSYWASKPHRSPDHESLLSKESEGFLYDLDVDPNSHALSPIKVGSNGQNKFDLDLQDKFDQHSQSKGAKLAYQQNDLRESKSISITKDSGISGAHQVETTHERKQRASFEEKLTNFLDDEDADALNHSLNAASPRKGVEASPSSKLQKLLLESGQMIASLEKSANMYHNKEGEGNTINNTES